MSTHEVGDLRGDLVGVGDTVAYAVTDGRSGAMRIGKVVEVVPTHLGSWDQKVPAKIRIAVEHSTGYGTLKRFVKVTP